MARDSKTSSIPRRRATGKKSKTSKSRASGTSRRSRKRSAPSVLGEMTRPTPRHERLLPRLFGRLALGLGALLVIGAFANSFLVLPVRSWFGQQNELDERRRELETLRAATDELQTEVDRLRTPEGLEDAAREELGFVIAGEERLTVIGESEAPIDLPTGWPYELVERIVATRVAEQAAEQAAEQPAEQPTEQPTAP